MKRKYSKLNPYMSTNNVKLEGVYRGRVEDIKDPLRIGRVRVRVPFLHKIDGVSKDKLPWASPCFMSASYDSGSFIVPEEGDTVWVAFEAGDSTKPVYLGSVYGIGSENLRYLGNSEDKPDIYSASDGKRYKPAYQDDTPKDVFENREQLTPSKKVIYKSPKGSTIVIEDKDECESLTIFDRVGQIFSMISPVKKFFNMNNGGSRRTDNVNKGLDFNMVKDKTILLWKSISGSFLRIVSRKDSSKGEFIIKNKDSIAGLTVKVGEDNSFHIFIGDCYIHTDGVNMDIKASGVLNIQATEVQVNSEKIKTSVKGEVSNIDPKESVIWVDEKDEEDLI